MYVAMSEAFYRSTEVINIIIYILALILQTLTSIAVMQWIPVIQTPTPVNRTLALNLYCSAATLT